VLKCSGWGFEEIDASRIVLVSPAGEVLAGDGPRHIEYPIHTDVMAAFAALDVPLRPLDHAGSLFCCPLIARFGLTGGLVKDAALPKRTRWPSAPTCGRRGSSRWATSTCSGRPRRRPARVSWRNPG
jgi:hypothetical protein